MDSKPLLYLIIPCYNEAGNDGVLPLTAPKFLETLYRLIRSEKIDSQSRILFVDDGSSDNTWEVIETLAADDAHVAGVRLSRNRGHQNALFAGLMEARNYCDIAISLDCDGQDDVMVMDQMVDAYEQGFDVVYGVRSDRTSDRFFKRLTAEGFYRLLDAMGAEVVFNHADYRLMSKRALDGLAEFDEVNLYLRGIVPLVGFPSTTVEYKRSERLAGKSHYSLRKMIGLAIDGITSLSVKPIKFVAGLGILFSLVGVIGVLWALIAVVAGQAVAGWASTVCAISLIGGIQLLCLGVIGEYIGKIYLEIKHRPRYIVSDRTNPVGQRDER